MNAFGVAINETKEREKEEKERESKSLSVGSTSPFSTSASRPLRLLFFLSLFLLYRQLCAHRCVVSSSAGTSAAAPSAIASASARAAASPSLSPGRRRSETKRTAFDGARAMSGAAHRDAKCNAEIRAGAAEVRRTQKASQARARKRS